MIWVATQGIELHHIQPGKSQQNAYIERNNGSIRNECLGVCIFETIADVQRVAADWR